ncbi:MAG: hypothetical protein DMG14_29460 [Acidobacteria bacterium]|nr:MAG: hypothetical protein DMG14_29460 [Acidobacteriota bacterium]
MVFSSNRKTRIQNLYRKSVTNGDDELILETARSPSLPPIGRLTAASCFISVSSPKRALTSGHCHWREIESLFQSSRRISMNGLHNFLTTEIGSPTNRTSRAALRFTSSHLPILKPSGEAG